jgi:hypothetical protein
MPIVRNAKTVVLALAVSGSSLAAFVSLGLASFEPEAFAAARTTLALEDVRDEVYAAPSFTIPDEVPIGTARVIVPDVSGLSVDEADYVFRSAELVLRPIHEGRPLDEDYGDYKISPKQSFGQQVWAGTEVGVQVHYHKRRYGKYGGYAMGY